MKTFLIINLLFISNLSDKPIFFTFSQLKGIEDNIGNSQLLPDSTQEAWVRNYTGPGDPFNFAYSIAVDDSVNVYVTGGSLGFGMSDDYDYATIKYNTSGVEQWAARYNGPGNSSDIAYALVVDDSGNTYVTGRSIGLGSFSDYATIKYDAMGVQQWIARYNYPENSEDVATAIAIDESGNVYVTGFSSGSGTSYDYATIKYNDFGVQQWAVRYNGPGNTNDQASALDVDLSGNVYVTGSSGEGSPNLSDYVTVKYNSSGVEQWVGRYSDWYDYAIDIAVDSLSNVYVTGYSYHLGSYYDYATVKYNVMGVEQWVSRYNGPCNSDDLANAIEIDAAGNVYVTGEACGLGTFTDYATVKYNSSGVEQWAALYNGPGNAVDRAFDLAVDGLGNVYVTGESRADDSNDDFATIKYNANGIQQWIARYNDPSNSFDLAIALAVDASGNVYVTGRSTDVGWSVYTTIKYEQIIIPVELTYFAAFYNNIGTVELIWITATELNNKGFEIERLQNSRITKFQDWITIGFVEGNGTTTEQQSYSFIDPVSGTGKNLSAGKYQYRLKQIDFDGSFEYSQIIEAVVESPTKFSLEQNYPNPFNPVTSIKYVVGSLQNVTLKVYDILGNEIETLVNEEKPAGTYEVEFDGSGFPSGVYFYKLEAGNFIETRKMVLIK